MTSCQGSGGTPPPALPPPTPDAVTLGPGDAFEVTVYGEDDLEGKYRVGEDGTINFPLVGAVVVGGKTTSEIALAIQEALREKQVLREPHVSVFLIEQTSRKVNVIGAVSDPGSYPMTRGMTAVQALSLAGGLTPLANGNGTILTRRAGDQLTRTTLRLDDITEGREKDFVLEPGDIIFVPERLF